MPYRRNNQPFSIDFHAITQSSAQQNTPFCSIKHSLSACKTWPFAQRKATKRSGSDSQQPHKRYKHLIYRHLHKTRTFYIKSGQMAIRNEKPAFHEVKI